MKYFPSLFSDELLYSVFSRYHRDSGNENHKLTMEDLFGDTNVCASLLFGSHLTSLYDRMPIDSLISPERLINSHTFLPYYSFFIPEERNSKIKRLMMSENGASVYMQLGIPASTVKMQQRLKYCPVCVIHDRGICGEAYWHRTHQAEGVIVCHKHDSLLISTNVTHHRQRNKHEFISLESTLKNEGLQHKPGTLKSNGILRFVAEQTNTLLSKVWSPIGLYKLNQFYVSKLQLNGLANYSGRINWTELIPAFNRFFGRELLEQFQSYIEPSKESTWLHKLLRKPRVTCHPLRHLLVFCFLGETIESVVNQFTHEKVIYEPFGEGPWPCLNKAASHYRNLEITSCRITRDSKTGLPVGTFSCSCGFVYSRKGPDQSKAGQFKIGRIKEFGEVWMEKLIVLSQQNISRREMARRLGCDSKTIVNKLPTTSYSPIVMLPAINQDSKRYKEEWKRLLSNNEKLSVTELRKLNRAAYAWLYRHDKTWLQEHSPSKKKISSNRRRVNWEERDHQISKEILRAANEILNEQSDKLIRVTKTELGRRISMPQQIFKMLHKLPETATKLEVVVESVEDFQRRRIKLKAEELKSTNMVLKRWKLIRSSGLRDTFIESHREVIDDLTGTSEF